MRRSRFCRGFSCISPTRASSEGPGRSSASSVAQRGLWREAIYRWEKAVEIDPTYAAASTTSPSPTNTKGSWTRRARPYEKALELEPNNIQIRQNFDLFKEINDRTSAAKDEDH